MKSSMANRPTESPAQFLAEDLVLEFLNTCVRSGREILDLLQNEVIMISKQQYSIHPAYFLWTALRSR